MFCYVIVFTLGYLTCKYLPDLRKRSFAAFMDKFSKGIDPRYEEYKKEAFGPIKDLKSQIPEMAEKNAVKILEIGVGTGTNFQFYPEGCHLVVVDPNPHFKSYYNENRAKFPMIKSEEIIVAGGEDMDMVPDDSVDAVVVSLVFCSTTDTMKILKQILRVLVPGGKMYFVEHVREWDSEQHKTRQILQDILTKIGFYPGLFDGCELNRDTLELIHQAGFSKVDAEKKHAPIDHFFFQLVSPQILGSATK